MNEGFFYCHSPNLPDHLQRNGQRYICVGLNEKTLRKLWQYCRTEELHRLLSEWQENRHTKYAEHLCGIHFIRRLFKCRKKKTKRSPSRLSVVLSLYQRR